VEVATLEISRKSGVLVEALFASAGATDFGAYFWRPELDNTLRIVKTVEAEPTKKLINSTTSG